MNTQPSSDGRIRSLTDSVEVQFLPLIDQLDLQPLQKEFLRARWLDQVRWMEARAESSQRWYNRLRLVTIVGSVIIPALIGLNVSGTVSERIRWSVFGLGLIVALAAAIEGFFHFGDRWPHYRCTAELLKERRLAVLPAQRAVPGSTTHVGAYPRFAAQVEAVIQHDVDTYLTTVVAEPKSAATEGAASRAGRRSDPVEVAVCPE